MILFSNPWFTDGQHSGFEQIFSGVLFVLVKGASHQVPQSKRADAYQLFESTVHGHKEETLFETGLFGKKQQNVEVIWICGNNYQKDRRVGEGVLVVVEI